MKTDHDAVKAVIDGVAHKGRRQDAGALLDLMTEVSGEQPRVWSANTIGFGQYHYRYKTGQEGDFFTVGFSPRKDRITLYIMSGLRGFEDILERLGPHQASKSTVHIKRLHDVDREALTELISECVTHVKSVEKAMGAIPRERHPAATGVRSDRRAFEAGACVAGSLARGGASRSLRCRRFMTFASVHTGHCRAS